MTIDYAFGIPVILALALASGFLANEWSHGGLSEALGAGHHHLLDFGGYHCVSHDDPKQGGMHIAHMHQADAAMAHEDCPGGAEMHSSGSTGGMPSASSNEMGNVGSMPHHHAATQARSMR